eukprot:gene8647-594_t
MGNCVTPKDQEGGENNKGLKLIPEKDLKLLLLGAGESGKSTIFKQIKLQNNKSYDDEDYEQYTTAVRLNIIISMKALIGATAALQVEIKDEKNKKMASKIQSWEEDSLDEKIREIDDEFGIALKALWEDHAIQNVLEQRAKYQLLDSTEYFFEHLPRICKEDYRASNEDILRCRVKTIGICNVEFKEEDIKFKVYDVGGQRNERRKWIHCFDNVNAIVFVVSLSEYDLTCYEDGTTPRMDESLGLFENICENSIFSDTPIILFFNKNDLFKSKIEKIDLSVWDKDYVGGCDYDKALKHIRDKFLALNTVPDRRIEVFVCTTTEANTFKQVFDQVKGTAMELLMASLSPKKNSF